jgi:multidrug efflux pump
VYTNDQSTRAADYRPLVIAYRNGAAVRLSDVAQVNNSVEDLRNLGLANGRPSVLIIIFRQPNANIIDTIDSVKAELPHLQAAMPADVSVSVAIDRSTTIRQSLHDTELTLVIAIILVVMVVFVFLRSIRATIIPGVAVPISILGTFGGMYLLGYSLDILSLMALTIATGFVVDDAIVVLENISRHLEAGMSRMQAAVLGAQEVGFTVLSISLSLIAVFVPILLMGGILGRLFREFTITLSLAIMISLAISLTTTPMMCALFLRPLRTHETSHGSTIFSRVLGGYERTLGWALRHSRFVIMIFISAIVLNVVLFIISPKGFFPTEDTGRLVGSLQADQSVSFQAMSGKLRQMMAIVQADPAVQTVVGYTGTGGGGFGTINTGSVFVSLVPISQRPSIDAVIARLRPKLAQVPGGRLFLNAVQDIRAGGRQSNSTYQYTLQSDSADDLFNWSPKLVQVLERSSVLTDVNSDQQQKGMETDLVIDRDTASRLGITPAQIDNTLYDAFGQRQVSVIYSAINQYHVVMEIDPRYTQFPASLNDVYVATSGGGASGSATSNSPAGTVSAAGAAKGGSASSESATAAASANNNSARNAAINSLATGGKGNTSAGAAVSTSLETMIPLSAISHYKPGTTPLAVNHQGLFVASTISFNLQEGASLGEASAEIDEAINQIHMPVSIHGSLAGTAQVFQQSLNNEPVLIGAAIAAVYILLGVLYESYIHPITILSTLPSAGVGALLALLLFRTEFDIIGMIGVILLIGIVKKNAIMMIDFAIHARRAQNLSPRDAIFQACLLRFRPIMMTTMAAILGAVPLAVSFGNGGEIRRPLGISIMGGLIISQLLTLYTTPVLYLYMDRFGEWSLRQRQRLLPGLYGPQAAE